MWAHARSTLKTFSLLSSLMSLILHSQTRRSTGPPTWSSWRSLTRHVVCRRERDVQRERERRFPLPINFLHPHFLLPPFLFSPFHTTIGRARLRPHRRGDGTPGLPGRPRLAAPGPALGDGRRVHSASAGAVGRAVPVLPGHRPGPHHRRRGRPAGGPAPAGRLQAAALHLRPPPVQRLLVGDAGEDGSRESTHTFLFLPLASPFFPSSQHFSSSSLFPFP